MHSFFDEWDSNVFAGKDKAFLRVGHRLSLILKGGEITMEVKRTAEAIEHKFGKGVSFQRIRRITGYLVGTMEQWNNAKRAEEHDRVKHMF